MDIRFEPSKESSTVREVEHGDVVTVLKVQNNWAFVLYNEGIDYGFHQGVAEHFGWIPLKNLSSKEIAKYTSDEKWTIEEAELRDKWARDDAREKAKVEQERRKELAGLRLKHPDWSGEIWDLISKGQVRIGMTDEQVRASWGSPDDVNRDVGIWGIHEQWVYPRGKYLYFENGIMTSFQD